MRCYLNTKTQKLSKFDTRINSLYSLNQTINKIYTKLVAENKILETEQAELKRDETNNKERISHNDKHIAKRKLIIDRLEDKPITMKEIETEWVKYLKEYKLNTNIPLTDKDIDEVIKEQDTSISICFEVDDRKNIISRLMFQIEELYESEDRFTPQVMEMQENNPEEDENILFSKKISEKEIEDYFKKYIYNWREWQDSMSAITYEHITSIAKVLSKIKDNAIPNYVEIDYPKRENVHEIEKGGHEWGTKGGERIFFIDMVMEGGKRVNKIKLMGVGPHSRYKDSGGKDNNKYRVTLPNGDEKVIDTQPAKKEAIERTKWNI